MEEHHEFWRKENPRNSREKKIFEIIKIRIILFLEPI